MKFPSLFRGDSAVLRGNFLLITLSWIMMFSTQPDLFGRKRFLILGYLLFVPGMLLFINADFNMLLIAFFFFGLGNYYN